MAATDTSDKPLRADAARNRQRILEAAAEVFAQRGLDVSLDDIAHAAGVGVGTVYRRFPCKDDLIDALFDDKMAELEAVGRAALEIEDPWEAFVAFMTGVCEHHARDRGLKEAMFITGTISSERLQAAKARMAPIGEELLRRAKASGCVRDDVFQFDVPFMHFTVGFAAERTREEAPEYWRRLLTIYLDGLRARRDDVTPMPSPPLAPEQFLAAMTRKNKR
jgi:AcrR family transcriptional regulator